MTCAAFREIVAAYVDGDIDAAQRQEIAAHLNACERCRALAEESRTVRETVRRYKRFTPIPAGLMEKVWRRIDGHVRRVHRGRRVIVGALAFAAVMALATVVPLIYPTQPIQVSDGQPEVHRYEPVVNRSITRTHEAYEIVRSKLNVNVSPVNLRLVGGRLQHVKVFEKPAVAELTYKLRGGYIRYYVSKTRFELPGSQRWVIEGRKIDVVENPAYLSAAWSGEGVHYMVWTDHMPPEPRGLLREFILEYGDDR